MKRWLIALLFPLYVHATAFSTDWTDVWLNPNEPGWGVTIYQQSDLLFVTFFVYGADGKPTWYNGSGVPFTGVTGVSTFNFSGPLYTGQGSPFNAPWNAGNLRAPQVGTVTLSFVTVQQGTITYSVDGTTITKPLRRYAFKSNTLGGSYIGATIGAYSNCGGSSGYTEEPGVFTITHSGTAVSINAQYSTGRSCSYAATYDQGGRFGVLDGTFACSNGVQGTFSAFELNANISGLTGRAVSQSGSCSWSGRIGGLRRN